MIASDLRFEGFDAQSWMNLLSLFDPGLRARVARQPRTSDAPDASLQLGEARQGTLIVVVDGDRRVLTALHSGRGAIEGLELTDPERLCEQTSTTRCFILRQGLVEEIFERLSIALRPDDDYATQWLTLGRIVRELREAGWLEAWPAPLAKVPLPTETMIARAFDLALPEGHSIVLALWEGSRLWTAAALYRQDGGIRSVVGPDAIARWTGPLGGDFTRDYRVIADSVGRALGPLHLGLFAEAHTFERLVRSREPGAWVRAVAVRDVILHPTPPSIGVALGADAANALLQRSSRILGGLDLRSMLSPMTSYLRERIVELRGVTSTLGFDPLEVLAAWMNRAPERDESNDSDGG